MLLRLTIILGLAGCWTDSRAWAADGAPFEFRSEDRVILLGNTLIEREQLYAEWELPLTLTNAGKQVTFRNLGWAADTVWAESRGIFDPPAKGYERMIAQINDLKPTVIVFAYGGVEAFDGSARLAEFETQFRKLIADVQSPNCRFVFLSPTLLELARMPVRPDRDAAKQVQDYRENVAAVCQVIERLALETKGTFVDLRPAFKERSDDVLTDNGLHLNSQGYRTTAQLLVSELCPGVSLNDFDLEGEQVQQLRELIRRKNELYFHRWRPQNITYLFGFRQHEQGNNAVEIPMFDPLVADLETKISELAVQIQASKKN